MNFDLNLLFESHTARVAKANAVKIIALLRLYGPLEKAERSKTLDEHTTAIILFLQ